MLLLCSNMPRTGYYFHEISLFCMLNKEALKTPQKPTQLDFLKKVVTKKFFPN